MWYRPSMNLSELVTLVPGCSGSSEARRPAAAPAADETSSLAPSVGGIQIALTKFRRRGLRPQTQGP